jgi:hypothetical protein
LERPWRDASNESQWNTFDLTSNDETLTDSSDETRVATLSTRRIQREPLKDILSKVSRRKLRYCKKTSEKIKGDNPKEREIERETDPAERGTKNAARDSERPGKEQKTERMKNKQRF